MEPHPKLPYDVALWSVPDPPPLALTTRQVAAALGCSVRTVEHLIRDGALKSVKINSLRRVTRPQLDAYLKRLEAEGNA